MNDKDVARLMKVARRIGRAEISGLGADGFTIEQNNGLPQTVPHLHVHVLPRYAGYNRCRGGGLRQPDTVLEPIAARLRTALIADRGQPVPPRPADDLPPPTSLTPQNTGFVPPNAVIADPIANATRPADIAAFQLPSHGSNLNAVLYLASGAGPHPTMLLLHGFPGNEQNLDLAQSVRRAGWNVLTLHYRGSWGSQGAFSFEHCAEDTGAALAWLRDPANVTKYGIDTERLVLAGHSMGGSMAGRIGAEDKKLAGIVLIDAADLAAIGRSLSDPAQRKSVAEGLVRDALPPLAGTSEAALMSEFEHAGPSFDLVAQAARITDRPLLVIGAERGIGTMGTAAANAARNAGGKRIVLVSMPTDHSFSDHRIALQSTVIEWLGQLSH
jgi:pimeloyl-ACP methyl ester carboxylesterase